MYLPIDFMEEFTNNSNYYVDKRRVLKHNLQNLYQKYMYAPFNIKSLYHIFYLILYMGVVSLPFKINYQKYDNIWSYHSISNEMGLIADWFTFLWRKCYI